MKLLFPQQLTRNGFELLPITVAHLTIVDSLPFHHRDPFDRLIVAQVIAEGLGLVSLDAKLDAYGVQRLWQLFVICQQADLQNGGVK